MGGMSKFDWLLTECMNGIKSVRKSCSFEFMVNQKLLRRKAKSESLESASTVKALRELCKSQICHL